MSYTWIMDSQAHQLEQPHIELPLWMLAPAPQQQQHQPPLDPTAPAQLKLRQYEIIFPSVLDRLAEGYTLAKIFEQDHRHLSAGFFLRWVNKDPQRVQMYKEAKELRSEMWSSKLIDIAEATENPLEDVARSKLKVDTYKFLMGADNRKAYGDTKTVEVNQSISIVGALRAAQERATLVERLDNVSDVTPIEMIEQAVAEVTAREEDSDAE